MLTLSDIQKEVDKQIVHNRNKSLFYELANGRLVLDPAPDVVELLKGRAADLADFIQSAQADGSYEQLIRYASDQTVKSFWEANQYLNFSRAHHVDLQQIYSNLFKRVGHMIIQMSLLHLNLGTIKEPLLDIGCGAEAQLVHFLRGNGINAFGMDRNSEAVDYLHRLNWLEYTFAADRWGTIVSHMAFSNHFTHQHLKEDGEFDVYARKYMEILSSLQPGGTFVYAPSLNFIEKLLITTNPAYLVERNELCTRITRIR